METPNPAAVSPYPPPAAYPEIPGSARGWLQLYEDRRSKNSSERSFCCGCCENEPGGSEENCRRENLCPFPLPCSFGLSSIPGLGPAAELCTMKSDAFLNYKMPGFLGHLVGSWGGQDQSLQRWHVPQFGLPQNIGMESGMGSHGEKSH